MLTGQHISLCIAPASIVRSLKRQVFNMRTQSMAGGGDHQIVTLPSKFLHHIAQMINPIDIITQAALHHIKAFTSL